MEILPIAAGKCSSVGFVYRLKANLRGEPVLIRDVSQSDQLRYPDSVREEGIGAVFSLPITFTHNVLDVLRLYHSEIWNISENDLESLSILAEIIGLTMM